MLLRAYHSDKESRGLGHKKREFVLNSLNAIKFGFGDSEGVLNFT